MNKNYDDEATQLLNEDNETTELALSNTDNNNNAEEVEGKEEVSKETVLKRAAVGAGSGLLIGGVATLLMGMQDPDKVISNNGGDKEEENTHPWVDDQVPVATTVTDDMSFGEAFAAARQEVGPGGCFEWHGQVYGTYTADEWNAMSPEERAEYGSHFSWNNIDSSSSNVAPHTNHHNDSHTAHTTTTVTDDDDIQVVSVNHGDNHRESVAENNHTTTGYEGPENSDDVVIIEHEPEIEILGVVHDPESGANIGGMLVDNQEVILVDVDGDLEFDFMGSDLNGNNQLDPGEVVDIQGQGLTVAHLGGFSDPMNDPTGGNMMAEDNNIDYSADVYEG